MGEKTSTNKFSRQTSEFKQQRFLWLNQVLVDPELPGSAFKVAYRIGDGFKSSYVQHDGRAWESCKEIARAIGMSEKTVITMVRRLHARDHLLRSMGAPGRGHPNHYWMLLKPASAQVFDEIKPASSPNKTCADAENQETRTKGMPSASPLREIGGCRTRRLRVGLPFGRPPVGGKEGRTSGR